jgi:hypothetical protein
VFLQLNAKLTPQPHESSVKSDNMGFRFQRRIRVAPGVRINLSKSGVGFGVGRTGLRLGMDVKRRKYFSISLPGTGLSYQTFFGRPVATTTLKKLGYAVIVFAIFALLLMLSAKKV